jgi:hypothetical protein
MRVASNILIQNTLATATQGMQFARQHRRMPKGIILLSRNHFPHAVTTISKVD